MRMRSAGCSTALPQQVPPRCPAPVLDALDTASREYRRSECRSLGLRALWNGQPTRLLFTETERQRTGSIARTGPDRSTLERGLSRPHRVRRIRHLDARGMRQAVGCRRDQVRPWYDNSGEPVLPHRNVLPGCARFESEFLATETFNLRVLVSATDPLPAGHERPRP